MKIRMIAITAFMAVALAGCGQIDEPLTTTNSNDQPAAQIEVQTASKSDAPAESTSETENTSTTQKATEKTSTETTSDVSLSETQAEDSTMNVISENNDTPQPQAEEKQSPAETEKSAATASTTQATTTQAETPNAPVVADSGQADDVFKMLDSLNYLAISCDGLPEYQITASDGTVYLINFDGAWVWRRPSLIADADNEAPLTQEVIDAIYANWDQLNIVKTEW
ncbi:hypothetical protein [Ruminococcus sp. XPD3002]|uniref:hypothetical protein n=1 Tax=Ruminococcus sp. XPD3002 TaxID=1452269 RepID=UPI000923D095|nr:hypothetical protein SAMN04487832_13013 [Ruminococcus flavefaciens]